MTDRRNREQDRLNREVDRLKREEDDERRADTERRGEQLRQAWREHHPQEEPEEDRPKKGGAP
jgi:hypothetical protein